MRHAHDGVERGTHLVAHVGEKFVLGQICRVCRCQCFLQVAGALCHQMFKLFVVASQIGFQLFTVSDVGVNPDAAVMRVFRIECAPGQGTPEGGAVAVLEANFFTEGLAATERGVGARSDIVENLFGGVQDAGGLPEHCTVGIAEQFFEASVARDNDAVFQISNAHQSIVKNRLLQIQQWILGLGHCVPRRVIINSL